MSIYLCPLSPPLPFTLVWTHIASTFSHSFCASYQRHASFLNVNDRPTYHKTEYKKGESQTNVEIMNEEDFNSLLRQEEEYIETICAQVTDIG